MKSSMHLTLAALLLVSVTALYAADKAQPTVPNILFILADELAWNGLGCCGAIHRAAGPELLAECRTLGGCPTGQAKITKGYRLLAKWVVHTVGPVWRDGQHNEPELLVSCYRSCFALAEKHGIRSIAFPSISTGAYGFPMDPAARIAVTETRKFLEQNTTVEKVLLVCFGQAAYDIHTQAVRESLG